MSLESNNFSLRDSVQNVIAILQPKAKEKKLKITTEFSPSLFGTLKGDSLKVEQILFNIIGNSLKFTSKGGISVKCSVLENYPHRQKISINITDTGIGMSEEYVRNIFKKFNQEDGSISRKHGGTGLGMFITRELVNLMKGEISVQSKKNIGTSITVNLPIDKGSQKTRKEVFKEMQNISIEGTKVLLVEDNELNQMVAENSLNHFKCNVTIADNGRKALDILKKERFDIVLMDIQMPEMDGIEATKNFRKEYGKETPIIALTANAFKTEIDNCIKAGMNDYITKPFAEENLLNIIYKYTKNQKKLNSMEKLYDLKSIKVLSRGDDSFVKKMISIFISQTKETIPLVEKSLEEKDFEEVARLIHKIKPSIEGMGILSIKEDIIQLELLAKESKTETSTLYPLFEKIKTILDTSIIQLQEEIK